MNTVQLSISTSSHTDFREITREVRHAVAESCVTSGLCHVYIPHTTAGVTINENADPSVESDIVMVLDRLVPWEGGYRHTEGNSAAHVKASLMGSSALIPVEQGKLVLGRWQGIFLCDFDGPRNRKVLVKVLEG